MKRGKKFSAFIFIAFLVQSPCRSIAANAPCLLGQQASLDVLIEKGRFYQSSGEFDKASDVLKEALQLARNFNRPREEAECLAKLGMSAWNLGQIRDSSGYFSEAALLYQKHGNSADGSFCRKAMEIINLYDQGKDYRSANQNQLSIERFEQAILLARAVGVKDFELKCLRQEGVTYWQMDELESFLACNKQGLIISQEINHETEKGRCLNNIGIYYERIGDYSKAFRSFEAALLSSEKARSLSTEAECLSNIGTTYIKLNDYIHAEEFYSRALKLDETIGNLENVAMDFNNFGVMFLLKAQKLNYYKDLKKAKECFNDCLKLIDSKKDSTLIMQAKNNIGYISYLQGDYKKAAKEFESCFLNAERMHFGEIASIVLLNLGRVNLANKDYSNAIKCFKNTLNIGIEAKSEETFYEAYFGLGQCYEAKSDLLTALSNYKKSIEAIERIRYQISLDVFKIGYARDKLTVYQRALDVLFCLYSSQHSLGLLEDMYLTVEKAKARAFLESLGEAKIDISSALNSSYQKREKDISREISKAFINLSNPGLPAETRKSFMIMLERKAEEYLRLISDIKLQSRGIADLIAPEICTISQARDRLLNNHAALMEYCLGDNKSYLFFITRDRSEIYELPSRERIENSLGGYLRMLSSPPQDLFNGSLAAERIGQELLFPLFQERLSSIDTLVIIPDGILCYLPFETLRIGHKGRSKYLVESYKTSYCPSASSLLLLKQGSHGQKPMKNLLAVGAPRFESKDVIGKGQNDKASDVWRELYQAEGFNFSSLPFSKKEILGIAQYFPPLKRDIFLGNEANEAVIKKLPLNDYQIIHFACHGFLDEKAPFRSALVLSRDERQEEDGFLQAREIYNLRMNADLVVLSACQTGKGSLEIAEGLLGLPRIFFYAGARSVLSSLWPIGDQSTADFMNEFYRGLSQGQDKSGALQLAKIRMLHSPLSHPFYWGAFVLSGDPGPVLFSH